MRTCRGFGFGIFILVLCPGALLIKTRPKPNFQEPDALISDQNLILTPYIQSGHLAEGRQASRVVNQPGAPPTESYSGYFAVNETYGNYLFLWFIPCANDKNAPILYYAVGGPDLSSMCYSSTQTGPFAFDREQRITERPFSWTKHYNLILVDSPVGVGFSYTNSKEGYSSSGEVVANEMKEALRQFFELFTDYQKNDLYLTGMSYMGRVMTLIGQQLHQDSRGFKGNLKGLILISPVVDGSMVINNVDVFYNAGLINTPQRQVYAALESQMRKDVASGNFEAAGIKWYGIDSGLGPKFVGANERLDHRRTTAPANFAFPEPYYQRPDVQKAFHVKSMCKFACSNQSVQGPLRGDTLMSTVPALEELLDFYPLLIFNGNFDGVVPAVTTDKFIRTLKWSGAPEFASANKTFFKVDGQVKAYVTSAKNFHHVVVRNAGHFVSGDQPQVTLDIMRKFTGGTL